MKPFTGVSKRLTDKKDCSNSKEAPKSKVFLSIRCLLFALADAAYVNTTIIPPRNIITIVYSIQGISRTKHIIPIVMDRRIVDIDKLKGEDAVRISSTLRYVNKDKIISIYMSAQVLIRLVY